MTNDQVKALVAAINANTYALLAVANMIAAPMADGRPEQSFKGIVTPITDAINFLQETVDNLDFLLDESSPKSTTSKSTKKNEK